MSAYCHKRSFSLRYTDFDFRDRLKVSTLLSLAQEAAGSSVEELGFGYEVLKEKNYAFITVHTDCILKTPARFGDTLTVETWPLPPRHVIFERDYRISNQMGEIIALLASRWCLIDLPRFVMLTPDALGEANERCPYNSEKLFSANWKIPKLGETAQEIYRTRVRNSLCDHYRHANNTEYADLFLDCFPMEEFPELSRIQIAYDRQAKEGAELRVLMEKTEQGATSEIREGDATVARCMLTFARGENR